MEKKKVGNYNAGYSVPEPIEIGRWYEKISQRDIDEFNRKEEERRKNWYDQKNGKIEYNDSDILGNVCWGYLRNREEEA